MTDIKKSFNTILSALQAKPSSLAKGYVMIWFSILTNEINSRLVRTRAPIDSIPILVPNDLDPVKFTNLFKLLNRFTQNECCDLWVMNHLVCRQYQVGVDRSSGVLELKSAVIRDGLSAIDTILCEI